MPTLKTTEADERNFIDAFVREGIALDYWWIDAGWYPCGQWHDNAGTWEVDKTRLPKGIRAVSDHAHVKGIKQILWFEPERVSGGSWIAKHHPEWVLNGSLLNLGNPAALKWLTDHVDKLIREQGIDLYRALDQWIAWQFNPPEQGDGCVQAFRREECADAAQIYRLHGLDPAATYEVENLDVAGSTRVSGKDLMEKGLTIEIKDKPGAAVIVYVRRDVRRDVRQ